MGVLRGGLPSQIKAKRKVLRVRTSVREDSSIFLNICHKVFVLSCRQKGFQLSTSKVYVYMAVLWEYNFKQLIYNKKCVSKNKFAYISNN